MPKKIVVHVETMIVAGKEYFSISDAPRICNREDLAYAAGIIDGEGSIIIGKGKQPVGKGYSYEVLVSVHMMDGYVPKFLSECFGGKVKKSRVKHQNKKVIMLIIIMPTDHGQKYYYLLSTHTFLLKEGKPKLQCIYRTNFQAIQMGKELHRK